MNETTLILAILLGAGFLAAKLGQLIRLPSVTGYIVVGLLLGPSGLNVVSDEIVGENLTHFIQIALMLIAFGIGEHLELKRLKNMLRRLGFIGLAETTGAFLLVGAGTYVVARMTGVGDPAWTSNTFLTLAIILGAISMATAPATTLHVMRELKAAGPVTTTLIAVVAIDNGLTIMMFGMVISAGRHLVGSGDGAIWAAMGAGLLEIIVSLLMGVVTGLLIDITVNRLSRRSEMLTIGLALLLFCGEGARLLGFSPLLAGMAAGFTLVNRDIRDVRLFRALNAFEPPVYVLFFTLAGAQLHIDALALAGWLGLVYFLLRATGKILGSFIGARLTKAEASVQRFLGISLIPQAGVAIGLIFLVQGDASLAELAAVITPVVLAGVVLSEIIGPVCARYAVEKAGEAADSGREADFPELPVSNGARPGADKFKLVPWSWDKLLPAVTATGNVVFGMANRETAAGLARMATLIAHYHQGLPLGVRVITPASDRNEVDDQGLYVRQYPAIKQEVESLGYNLKIADVRAESVAAGILATAKQEKTWGIVLGYPQEGTDQGRIVEAVARQATCPVIMVRFTGMLHTERILVPVTSTRDLQVVTGVVASLSGVGKHRVTILRLLPSISTEEELEKSEEKLVTWALNLGLLSYVRCQAVATEARLETIVREAGLHDLLVMAASETTGLQRFFFGSLVDGVARHCKRSLLLVHAPRHGSGGNGNPASAVIAGSPDSNRLPGRP